MLFSPLSQSKFVKVLVMEVNHPPGKLDLTKLIVAYWRHMATETWVKIGSGNGLLPNGAKPLPESMLT